MQLNFLNDFWEINIIVLFFVIKYFKVLNKLFFKTLAYFSARYGTHARLSEKIQVTLGIFRGKLLMTTPKRCIASIYII